LGRAIPWESRDTSPSKRLSFRMLEAAVEFNGFEDDAEMNNLPMHPLVNSATAVKHNSSTNHDSSRSSRHYIGEIHKVNVDDKLRKTDMPKENTSSFAKDNSSPSRRHSIGEIPQMKVDMPNENINSFTKDHSSSYRHHSIGGIPMTKIDDKRRRQSMNMVLSEFSTKLDLGPIQLKSVESIDFKNSDAKTMYSPTFGNVMEEMKYFLRQLSSASLDSNTDDCLVYPDKNEISQSDISLADPDPQNSGDLSQLPPQNKNTQKIDSQSNETRRVSWMDENQSRSLEPVSLRSDHAIAQNPIAVVMKHESPEIKKKIYKALKGAELIEISPLFLKFKSIRTFLFNVIMTHYL
jgi:hypothetical protein